MNGSRGKSRRQVDGGRQFEWRCWGRWLLSTVLLLLLAGGSGWGIYKLQDPAILPLTIVRIDGEFRQLDRRDLEQAVSGAISGNFFTVDLEQVRAAALKLAWVDQATVRRIWPGTLSMWVVEQQPLAYWGKDELVNGRGDIFSPQGAPVSQELPRLQGPRERAIDVVQRYRELSERLAKLDLHIRWLQMDHRGAWSVAFADGTELKLGQADTALRIDRFVRLYPRLVRVDSKKVKRVDMRYANGVAVLWEEAS
ncbi:MAG: cell division protein FtsQ/DivIB [Sedimenticola sp.]|nr:cell division protein FtsQ/DivIB [Sedimenticola sp.]